MGALMLKASPDSYGLIAKLFHWVLALVILWQLFTGINLNQMEPSVEKGQFIWFHQITGTFLFCGIGLRLLWKFYNRPVFEDNLPKRHRIFKNSAVAIVSNLPVVAPSRLNDDLGGRV